MLYDLPIPFLPNQEQRWNQHSFLKRIPSDSLFEECALVLLHHKFRRDVFLTIEAAQHGHRDKDLMSVTINRRRIVATEFGM
jgi:hypothetical protein